MSGRAKVKPSPSASLTEFEIPPELDWDTTLLMSVDLIGSTQYKHQPKQTEDVLAWARRFERFYDEFGELLAERYEYCKTKLGPDGQSACSGNAPILWKTSGDELIFRTSLVARDDLVVHINALRMALEVWRDRVSSSSSSRERLPLQLKGAAWTVVSPVLNHRFDMQVRLEDDAGKQPSEIVRRRDYLGPAVDRGFRVCALASRTRLALSVELAHLLLGSSTHKGLALEIHCGAPVALKGVLAGEPYPSLWIDLRTTRDKDDDEVTGQISGLPKPDLLEKYLLSFMQKSGIEPHFVMKPGAGRHIVVGERSHHLETRLREYITNLGTEPPSAAQGGEGKLSNTLSEKVRERFAPANIFRETPAIAPREMPETKPSQRAPKPNAATGPAAKPTKPKKPRP